MNGHEQKTIVIVDDHPVSRAGLRQLLAPLARIREAESLSSLMRLLADTPRVDLVLLDIHMPDCGGLSGLIYLRACFPKLAIAALHEDDNRFAMRACLDQGACASLPKSLAVSVLREAIVKAMQGGVWALSAALSLNPTDESLVRRFASLTPQEARLLNAVMVGLTNAEIGDDFGVTIHTVKRHLSNMSNKLGVRSRIQLINLIRHVEHRPWHIAPHAAVRQRPKLSTNVSRGRALAPMTLSA